MRSIFFTVNMKSIFLTGILLFGSFLLNSCGTKSNSQPANSEINVPLDDNEPEKPELTLGFIKLTDMAALAIAKEKGFFEDEGLYVKLEAQANWKVLLDRVISGELDGAHMLAGQS